MSAHPDSLVIDRLGGATAVAALFGIAPQAVSQWRRSGIPRARRMYLELATPSAFRPAVDADAEAVSAGDESPGHA